MFTLICVAVVSFVIGALLAHQSAIKQVDSTVDYNLNHYKAIQKLNHEMVMRIAYSLAWRASMGLTSKGAIILGNLKRDPQQGDNARYYISSIDEAFADIEGDLQDFRERLKLDIEADDCNAKRFYLDKYKKVEEYKNEMSRILATRDEI